MPLPPLFNNFEYGVNGGTVSVANTVGLASTAFSGILSTGGTLTHSNTQLIHGSLCLSMKDPGAGNLGPRWIGLTQTGNVYARAYVRIPSAPASGQVRPIKFTNGAGQAAAYFEITSGGKMLARDQSSLTQAGTSTFPTAAWVRIEIRVFPSATVGEVECKYWSSPESTGTATETVLLQNCNTRADIDQVWFGSADSAPAIPYTFYQDDVAVATGGFIGPTGFFNTAAPTVTGDLTVGGTLTANPGTWTPTPSSYQYYWHREDDAAGTNLVEIGATGATYTLAAADVGKYIRAGVIPVA